MKLIPEEFQKKKVIKNLNAAIMSLILKVEGPENVTQFRPICLICSSEDSKSSGKSSVEFNLLDAGLSGRTKSFVLGISRLEIEEIHGAQQFSFERIFCYLMGIGAFEFLACFEYFYQTSMTTAMFFGCCSASPLGVNL